MTRNDQSRSEDELRFAALVETLKTPTEEERAFYALRQKLGIGVGLDRDGNLIYAGRHANPS